MPILFLLVLIITAMLLWHIRKRLIAASRAQLFNQPIPQHWISLLEDNVSLYSRLPNKLKQQLHGCIQLFINEKEFIGHGIAITEQIKLTIAGNACLLLLQGQNLSFQGFTSILVYPDTYVARQTTNDGVIKAQEDSHRNGESWFRGPIVLSWKDTLQGSLNPKDGHNVVIHEFAHKLDEQSGKMNGLPILREHLHYSDWARVLSKEFDSLKRRSQKEKSFVLDEYGAVSPP